MSADGQRALIDACIRHGIHFWWRGPGTFLIQGSGIVTVLADVVEAGHTVLGLEGFELESEFIHPRLDLIRDFSTHGGDPLAAAEAFGDVWVDVTLGSRPAARDIR